MQQHGLFKVKKASKFPITIGTPERKILISICYYVIMTLFTLTAFTIATRNAGAFSTQLLGHFSCEQLGQDPENPVTCDRNDFRQLSNPEVSAVALILLVLQPVVNLVYALNVKELTEKCTFCLKVKKFISSESTKNTS
jgi:hypothetical protein